MNFIAKIGKKKLILGIVGIVVVLLVIAYISVGAFFQSHFQFHTVINGVDCSSKTIEDVEALITQEVEQYQLSIIGREGQEDTITSTQIGLYPEFDGSLEALLKEHSGFSWPASLFRETKTELETMVNYDEKLLEDTLDGLVFFEAKNVKEPEDAHISEYQEGVGYQVIPEVEGTALDRNAMNTLLAEAITNLQSEVSLEEGECYLMPEIRSDDQRLNTLAEQLNTYTSTAITYEFGSKSEKLDGSLISQWISVGEDDQINVDSEAAAAFVQELASKYDTYGKSRSFKTTWGSTINFSNSNYGWKIDQEAETEQILADIPEGKQETREPAYSHYGASHDGEDHGGTYVEVNITAQHLYFYKNGSLVMDCDFVSGNESSGHTTPSGVFSVAYTQKDKVLVGEDYRTPVSYWMPFNGGIGFHDANWRSDFGGNYYKTSGSHGCINMPFSSAKTMFNSLKAGDAVFVYRLEGTESQKGRDQDAAAEVDAAIAAIGEVDLWSQDAIAAARGSYDELSDSAKGYVKNYDTLESAESIYNGLVAQQEAEAAARAEEDQARRDAQPVIDAINSIGEVTLEKADIIKNARNAYNALSAKAQNYVSNLPVLIDAETKIAAMQAS